ncbi:phenolic glucoside malonyltransferase 1-like [Quillaja saponaria]|uniref:Phenolic glucoside malonyltransferase 1-like n=1 Tax=Quillaja saponaria TaxID=32244 RepID=A0AAD7LT32_QUISA|nr:phenolic glucoside malonyltransferase 1-like [Quillaja saponaria]
MEQSDQTVKILEVLHVAPPLESVANSFSLSLTFFDLLWLRSPPPQIIFFYEFSHPPTVFFDSALPNLKQSLSLTLYHFIPLAGTLTWPHNSHKPIINYIPGYDSVSLTIAESNTQNFRHLSGTNNLCGVTECHPLLPNLTISHEKASLLSIQVTLFPNSGFCIGITLHHVVMDGKTFTSFMKSWAYISCSMLRGDQSLLSTSTAVPLPEYLTPFFDRNVIKDPTGIAAVYLNEWLKQDGGPNNRSLMVEDLKVIPDELRGAFELPGSNIEKLRQLVITKLKVKKVKHYLSNFTLTCAFVWFCLVKAQQEELIKHLNVAFSFTVDCRSRLEPPISSSYFGNCVGFKEIVVNTKAVLGKDGFIVVVEALSNAVRSLGYGWLLSKAKTWVSPTFNLQSDSFRRLGAAGSDKFDNYSVDYGWGRPNKVEMTSIDKTGSVCFGGKGNGGVEVNVVLKKHEMEAFASHFVEGLKSTDSISRL